MIFSANPLRPQILVGNFFCLKYYLRQKPYGYSMTLSTKNSFFGQILWGSAFESTISYFIVQSSTLQYNIVLYSTEQYLIVQYRSLQYRVVPYSTMQFFIVQSSTLQYNIVFYNTEQYLIVRYRTLEYYRVVPCTTISSFFFEISPASKTIWLQYYAQYQRIIFRTDPMGECF